MSIIEDGFGGEKCAWDLLSSSSKDPCMACGLLSATSKMFLSGTRLAHHMAQKCCIPTPPQSENPIRVACPLTNLTAA